MERNRGSRIIPVHSDFKLYFRFLAENATYFMASVETFIVKTFCFRSNHHQSLKKVLGRNYFPERNVVIHQLEKDLCISTVVEKFQFYYNFFHKFLFN